MTPPNPADAAPDRPGGRWVRWALAPVMAVTGPWTWQNLRFWAAAIGAFLIVTWLGVQQFTIPSGSMEPTLHGDPNLLKRDRVWVNKWRYGPRIPFTTHRLFRGAAPERWDIVVFKAVQPNAEHGTLIKRVVGLPGERVEIRDDGLYIEGRPVEIPEALRPVLHYTRGLVPTQAEAARHLLRIANREVPAPPIVLRPEWDWNAFTEDIRRLAEQLRGVSVDTLTDEEVKALMDDAAPVTREIATDLLTRAYADQKPFRYGVVPEEAFTRVPEDCYFLLGDNSARSVDGRYFGWVPNGHLLGRAFCVWWPPRQWHDLTGFAHSARFWAGCGVAAVLLVGGLWLRARRRARAARAADPD